MGYRMICTAILASLTFSAASSAEERHDLIALGALSYSDNCSKCHQNHAYGEEALYPSLHDPELLANKPLLISTILHGRSVQQNDNTAGRLMPSFDFLTNEEVAAIIAYISDSWGQGVLWVTEEEVAAARLLLR